jgi:methionine synthase II (cobalamin-independent)
MCLWYALLYATCEGLESGKVDIAHEVVDRYAEVRDELRRFRNAVFHVQANLEPDKLMDVFESESMVPLVRSLHEQIGKYVLREIRQLPSYQEGVEDHMA